jgi:hypothetical protein
VVAFFPSMIKRFPKAHSTCDVNRHGCSCRRVSN